MLRFLPRITVAILLIPVLGGLLGTALPAFGFLPALGGTAFGFDAWRTLLAEPGVATAIALTLGTGIAATALSATIALLLSAATHDRPWFRRIEALLGPLLAVPHAALAIGLAFLIAPSGWAVRLVSPWATGWERPPDVAIVNDPLGLSLILGLAIKEVPYLLLMILGALAQIRPHPSLALARTLGYRPMTAWLKVVLPQVYPLIRLPVYAVLAFSLSVVDVALILGPTAPPTLGPLLLRWFTDRDLARLFPASAGAILQLLIVAASIGLWRIGEILAVGAARAWLSSGGRGERDPIWRGAATGLGGTVIGLGFLGLVTLLAWSVAGPWRFPDALPDRLSLFTWQQQAIPLLSATGTTLSLALAAVGLALVLAIGCLEAERRHGLVPGSWAVAILYLPLLVPQTAFLFGTQIVLIRLDADGTWLAVLWAHLLFVLPYVFLSLADPWRRFDPRYERVAGGLGVGPWRRLVRLKAPMLLQPILIAASIGFAVSVAQYLPTLLVGAGRWPSLTTEAVTLAAGGDRRVVAALALLQSLLPLGVYLAAIFVPAWIFRDRRAMRRAT